MKNKPLAAVLILWSAVSLVKAQMPAALPAPLIQNVINAPNPFDSRRGGLEGQTRISYSLLENAQVCITLYDLLGHRVREWRFSAGESGGLLGDNNIQWDGTNEWGQKVSKGGYLARIQVDGPAGSTTTLRKIGVIH